jgi:hypothetical protein
VDATAAMLGEGRRHARLCEVFNEKAGAREWKPSGRMTPGTPPGPSDRGLVSGRANGNLCIEHQKITITSSWTAGCGRRGRPIRKKVIGHARSVLRKRFTVRSLVLHLLRAFPLLHQPAREHGRGIFLHPLVEKRANFLAEIGGMAKTRKFVALQRISRSREKKLPRRLGLVVGHAGLLEYGVRTLALRKLESRITRG